MVPDFITSRTNSESSLGDELRSSPPSSLPSPPVSKALCNEELQWAPSVEGVDRQSPTLPERLPQLPINVTPTNVVDAVNRAFGYLWRELILKPQDYQTPDSWIKRNAELIRLTGRHPFNCEAPLPRIMDSGFFTPAHLHFVRNHGAVPRVDEEALRSWSIRVHGLVSREATFTLQDLKEYFRTVTLPVTLVCAGNRRKEQNVVRKSLGFDWGCAGLSTALWTGVLLADILEYVQPLRRTAKHVIFEGADELPDGPYGTSQRLSWAQNREKGMLIAWAMNGLPLEPDHGFPVRVIIPGQIGGRSVKWLRRIQVSADESSHHLHYWDNKVLPRTLSPSIARANPSWWYDPAYIITELNVNSAITSPRHGETLYLTKTEGNSDSKTYTLQGYAYSGGGRRVNRCEVSLDEGQTWSLCQIEYPEDLFREIKYVHDVFGTLDLTDSENSFCWCFWSIDIPIVNLAKASVIELCAMDESMNTQPRDIYLNATSMLNNWLFRVAVLKLETPKGPCLRFEHPAPVGTSVPGWMERMKLEGRNLERPKFSTSPPLTLAFDNSDSVGDVPMIKSDIARKISAAELAAQDKAHPWFVVRGEVYDGTPFLDAHPGGPDSILIAAGEDATDDFLAIHSPEGRAKLAEYHIGTLADTLAIDRKSELDLEGDNLQTPFLQPRKWQRSRLVTVTRINHDSCIFRFALDDSKRRLGLPCGQHVFLRLRHKDTGELIQRAYTPISPQDAVGYVEFLIKLYRPTEVFPLGGKMSAALEHLGIGDQVEVKGPLGAFEWTYSGSYRWKHGIKRANQVGMIYGGSGVTPIFQVLRGIVEDQHDVETRIWLVCTNQTEEDILLRRELDEMATRMNAGSERMFIYHTLTAPSSAWRGGLGRIDETVLASHLPAPSDEGVILVCGPHSMVEETIRPILRRIGWDVDKSLVIF